MIALVVGGQESFVKERLAPRLLKHGIEVGSIWDWDHARPIQSIPKGCNCVIVLKDMVGHPQRDVVRALAKRGGLPFAEIPRKWAVAYKDLMKAGLIHQNGEMMGRRRNNLKTTQLVLQEDYTQTLTRIVEFAKGFYEKNGKRPKAVEVSTALAIPTYHVALQRGINEGIATAKGKEFKTPETTPLNELVEMALQDNPESILTIAELTEMMADLMNKSAADSSFKKRVLNLSLAVQKRWRRASDKRGSHPDKVYLRGLQNKWGSAFISEHQKDVGRLPTVSEMNIESHGIFKTGFTKRMYDALLEGFTEPEVKTAEEITEPEVKATEEDASSTGTVLRIVQSNAKNEKGSKVSVRTKGRIAKYFHMLGQVPDGKVAELCGVSQTTVCRYRNSLGIAKCRRGKGRVVEVRGATAINQAPIQAVPTEAVVERLDEVEVRHTPTHEQNGQLGDEVEALTHLVGRLREQIVELSRPAETPKGTLGSHIDALIAQGFKVSISIGAVVFLAVVFLAGE